MTQGHLWRPKALLDTARAQPGSLSCEEPDCVLSHGPCGFQCHMQPIKACVCWKGLRPDRPAPATLEASRKTTDIHRVIGNARISPSCFSLGCFGFRNMQVSFVCSNAHTW